ncbi:MAG: type II toxin-antitoxin system RelE/ParE family toxin [Acidobacteria bacterium]|nr:type II toxin-antitoxin system RelE/ParE family toxin [Acidobacteriota bacterium]
MLNLLGWLRLRFRMRPEWWQANRPKAPNTFEEELRRGCDLIAQQPAVGALATNPKLQGVRRIHLSRIRYHLYYRVQQNQVEILALWHPSRGSGPMI